MLTFVTRKKYKPNNSTFLYRKKINTVMGRGQKEHPFGPITSSLPVIEQKFVEYLLSNPAISNAQAMRMAGYKGTESALRKRAYRAIHKKEVLEAIREGGALQLGGMVPVAVDALNQLIKDPNSRHHYKAVEGVLNRAGMPEVKETKTTVVHTLDRNDLITKIVALSQRLGIGFNSEKLLPQPVIQAGDVEEQPPEDG